MKLFLSALLSLALLVVSGMDVVHAAPHQVAMTEMPMEDDAPEMSCCDSLSGRTIPCLGDALANTAGPTPRLPQPIQLRLAPAAAPQTAEYLPEIPTGPPKG